MLFSVFLLSSEGTNVEYLFPLLCSMYLFVKLEPRYKGFTLLIVAHLRSLTVTYPM